MKRISARWLVAGALVAVVLLAANVVLTYHNTQELYQSATWVSHTHDVLAALNSTLSLAKDAETGQRGFIITGEEAYLEPYNAAVAAIHRQVDEFEQLTADNPRHQARIPELRARIAAKLDELNRTIAVRRTDGADAARAVVLTGQGKAEMDALRSLVGEMIAEEQALRGERTERRDHTFRLAIFEGLLSGVCALLAIGAFLSLLRRHLASRERAAFVIAEQGERLRTTLASIGDGVIATDIDGRVTMMNAVAESLTGWKFADARNEPLTAVFNIVNEQTGKTVENPTARALREGVIVGLANHTILIAKDGTERPIDDSAAPIRCAKNELVGCVLVFRDVTEHRAHERALREREQRLASMLESLPDAFYTVDKDGRFTFISERAAARFSQGGRQDVLGKHIWDDVFPDAKGTPAYMGQNRSMAERVVVEYEIFFEPWQRWFFDRVAPTADGGLAVYSLDITQRKQAEEQVRRGAEMLDRIVEHAPSGFYIVDADFRISHINADSQARAFCNVNPAIGRRFDEAIRVIWPEPLATEIIGIFRHTLETGEPYRSPGLLSSPDLGSEESYEWQLDRITMPDGRYAVVCYYYDTTALRRAESDLRKAKEEAETANVAKDNFLSTLSHELRTPLTPVLSTLGEWENAAKFPPELQDDLRMVRRNIDLEARLIDDLLDLTRISRGKLALNLEVMDVQKLLDSVVSMYRSEISAKKIDLALHPSADHCFVRGDPGRLQQAFWNLLKNAVKFTAEGGKIDVTTRNDAHGRIQILVQDNGIGMSPQMLARLFTPFEQENQEHLKRYGGLGLGLAITRMLLEAQDGQITAHSDGKYRGATFVITLPCVQPPAQQSDEPAKSAEGNGDAKAEHEKCFRVLLVEDHLDTARVLSRLMQKNGHEVTMAHSVSDAISALRAEPFDVLVSDIGLPDGTGIDLIRQVRQQYGLNVPAVALTGFGMDEDVARCREAGFTHHLTKPVNFAKLEDAIQRVATGEAGIECP